MCGPPCAVVYDSARSFSSEATGRAGLIVVDHRTSLVRPLACFLGLPCSLAKRFSVALTSGRDGGSTGNGRRQPQLPAGQRTGAPSTSWCSSSSRRRKSAWSWATRCGPPP